MSKIDDLIRQRCPEGVEFKAIRDICVVKTGGDTPSRYQKGQKVPSEEYPYPIYSNGTETYGYSNAYRIGEQAVTISSIGNVGFVAFREANFTPIIRLKVLIPNSPNELDTKYLYYILQTMSFIGTNSSLSSMKADDVKKRKIPLPPLEIQKEIVNILDKFTLLGEELEEELEARKKQYEYYRDELFSFDDDRTVKWAPLGQVGKFIRGKRFTKEDYADDGIGAIHYGEIYTHYGTSADKVMSHVRKELKSKLRYAKPGDVVITDVGETVEDVGKAVAWLGDGEVAIHDHCYAFRHTMNPEFVSYYMQTSRFRSDKAKYVARTKVKTLLVNGLAKVSIPVPSLGEQDRIVSILSSFDFLVNSSSEGLPAEISARHKQYEYYRDKLLVFQELAS